MNRVSRVLMVVATIAALGLVALGVAYGRRGEGPSEAGGDLAAVGPGIEGEGYPAPRETAESVGEMRPLAAYPEPTARSEPAPTLGLRATPWYNLPTPVREGGPTPTAWPAREVATGPQGTIITLEEQSDGGVVRWLTMGADGELQESVVTVAMADQSPHFWSGGTRLSPSPDGLHLVVEGVYPYHFDAAIVSILDLRSGDTWDVDTTFEPGDGVQMLTETWFGGWWPDSRHILLYDRSYGGIYLVDIMGDEPTVYLSEKCAVGGVTVTPDGQRLAILASPLLQSDYQMWLSWGDGRQAEQVLVSPAPHTLVAWSPDGQDLLYMRGLELWLMDRDGHNQRPLGVSHGPLSTQSPVCWSPDGQMIAYTQEVRLREKGPTPEWGEYVTASLVEVATGETRPLVRDGREGDLYPVWSPDGEWLAFLSNRSGAVEVWVVGRDGTGLRQLTDTGNAHYGLAWVAAPAGEGWR